MKSENTRSKTVSTNQIGWENIMGERTRIRVKLE